MYTKLFHVYCIILLSTINLSLCLDTPDSKIESSPLSDTFHMNTAINEVTLIKCHRQEVFESGDNSIFASSRQILSQQQCH